MEAAICGVNNIFSKPNRALFIAGSVFGRGIRFGIVATLSYFFGEKAINFITNNLALTTVFLGVFFTILWFLII